MTTEITIEEALLDVLLKLQKDSHKGKLNVFAGICSNLGHYVTGDYPHTLLLQCLNSIFIKWPKYSGDPLFPVPNTKGYKNPNQQYQTVGNMWVLKYGKLRKELLQFSIDYLRTQLETTKA